MKKVIIMALAAILLCATLTAQPDEAYQNLLKSFISGTISDKTIAVERASGIEGSEGIITEGLVFADTYAGLLGSDPKMIELAARSVMSAGKCESAETFALVMSIFQKYEAPLVRQSCLNYLLDTRRATDRTATAIETYALDLLDDSDADEALMHSCIAVLDKIHSNTSFRVFFNYAANTLISDTLKDEALTAMNRLSDVYRINMLSIITDSAVPYKLTALQMILKNETNSDVLRAEAAETALSTSIIHAGDSVDDSLTDLQLTALGELRQLSWTRAASLAAEFFTVAISEYEAGILLPEQFIEVIDSVRELSVVKAGALFTEYLNTCNANVENGLSCSTPVVLAVINSLGALGDKVSFDALLYVSYVPYPDEVILASREALARLKW